MKRVPLRFLVCALPFAALGALLAPSATAAAANALFQAKVIGFTSMILVQLVHDTIPLMLLVVGSRLTLRYHQLSHVVFISLAALLVAALEPVVSSRLDTVIAAWQSLRLVARLSAFLFALTFAAYFDSRR